MIKAVGRFLLANSSFDLRGRDTLDKAPRPFPAIGSSWRYAIVRPVRVQACGRHLARAILRRLHTTSARSDSFVGIGSGFLRGVASLWCAIDRRAPLSAGAGEIRELISRYWRVGRHLSTATDYVGRRRAENEFHRYGIHGQWPLIRLHDASAIVLCSDQSSIFDASAMAGIRSGIRCKSLPWQAHGITSY